jgi:hypothetical protein
MKGEWQMKRVTLALAALALMLGGAGQAKADMILPTHAAVLAQSGFAQPVDLIGNGALDTGLITAWAGYQFNYLFNDKVQASTTPSSFSLLHAYASETRSDYSSGRAAWRDVAFVNNGNQPSALRLNFLVDGSLAAAGSDDAAVYLNTSNDPIKAFSEISAGNFILGRNADNPYASATLTSNHFVASGWDSYTFDGSSFMGTLHIDTPYDPKLGGYGWAVELIAAAEDDGGGSATSDFGNTASLQSVTLPDGTPVSGVTFDSGLTFGPTIATPEPASLTLLGIGIAGFAGYGWRRRRRSA